MTVNPPTPGWYPPPQPPKPKRKKWPWIVGGIAAFIVIGVASGHKGGDPKPGASVQGTAPAAVAPAKPSVAPAGTSVRDGQFEFKVVNVDRAKTVGDVTAQGEFFVVTLSIENTGKEARSFSGINQKLMDTVGRQYSANSAVDFYESGGDINPGNSIQARVAFDMSPGAVPSELVLHDSMFSGGAHLGL